MTIQKFQNLLEKGWGLDHIFILENLDTISNETGYSKVADLIQKLYRKGMVNENGGITERGEKLLEFAHSDAVEDVPKAAKPKISEGIEALHGKLEGRLVHLTGKKQVRVNILGKTYPFLCGKEDLEDRVKKTMIKYKLSDFQKIEDCLLGYIESCNKRKNWSPLLMYYVTKQKDGSQYSQMVTDMRNWDEGKLQSSTNKDFEI